MTTSANSRVVAPMPVETMSGVRVPLEHASALRRRAVRRAALAETLAEHERGREEHRRGIRDTLACDVFRRSVPRQEDARPRRARRPDATTRGLAPWATSPTRGSANGAGVTTTSKRPGSNASAETAFFIGNRSTRTPGCLDASRATALFHTSSPPTDVTGRLVSASSNARASVHSGSASPRG